MCLEFRSTTSIGYTTISQLWVASKKSPFSAPHTKFQIFQLMERQHDSSGRRADFRQARGYIYLSSLKHWRERGHRFCSRPSCASLKLWRRERKCHVPGHGPPGIIIERSPMVLVRKSHVDGLPRVVSVSLRLFTSSLRALHGDIAPKRHGSS